MTVRLGLRWKVLGALCLCSMSAVLLIALMTPWMMHRRFMQQAKQAHFSTFTHTIARYIAEGHHWGGRRSALDMYRNVLQAHRRAARARATAGPGGWPPPRPGRRLPPPPAGRPPPARGPQPWREDPAASENMRFVLADQLGYVFNPFFAFKAGQRLTAAQRARADRLYLHGRVVGYALATGTIPVRPQDRSYLQMLHRSLWIGGAVAVLISLLAGLALTEPMLRRLRRLDEAVTRWRPDGSASAPAPVRGSDEIAQLAQQFNRMSRELSRQYAQLQSSHATIAEQARSLKRLSHTDELTGLYNRRYFNEQFARLLDECRRQGGELALIIIDVDHFKQVNDGYSHQVGDAVLCELASLLRAGVREQDVVCRHGGEELVVLMPGAAGEEAAALSQRLRRRIETHAWERIAAGLKVTASFGVAGRGESPREMLRQADRQLYRAKAGGRNRVCMA